MSLAAGSHAMRAAGAQPGGVDAWQESGLAGICLIVVHRSPGRLAGPRCWLAARGMPAARSAP